MIAAILAGGKGTRLGALAEGLPKPMVPLAGKPVLEYQIELLKKCGIDKIVLLVGYKAEVIKNHFKDGSSWGVSIAYSNETEPLGTAGSVRNAAPLLDTDFLLLYGDVMVDMDFGRMIAFHERNQAIATLAVHPNSHPNDSYLMEIDERGRINRFFPKPHVEGGSYQNLVNAGVYVLSPEIIPHLPLRYSDFGKDIFPELVRKELNLYGYVTSEYIKDMGTPQRLAAVERDVVSGKASARNLSKKQRAIFLDRDGVINDELNLISHAEDIRLLPGVPQAIKKINESQFLCVVVTNQPAVARGLCDIGEIKKMHNRIDTLLGTEGAFIDDYFFCPHHPDKGFPGENPEYKIPCACRKPAIGMIEAAAQKFNIDLAKSYIIGDATRDIQTGKNGGLFSLLVKTGVGGTDNLFAATPDHIAADLSEAVDFILNRETTFAHQTIEETKL
jgi:mannose-1-phosphate guanylyltransferase/phosphomannomutase